eukprot:Awhi_evm1s14070
MIAKITQGSPYLPLDSIPHQCRNTEVEAYINSWEANVIDFESIEANDSVPIDQRFCK